MSIAPGMTIAHYKVLHLLGEGGMGVVYKAEDLKLGRLVALKFLPPEWTNDLEAKARFLQEARAISKIDHPNICAIFEIDNAVIDQREQMFIAMPCYEGETLKKRIHRGTLSIPECVDIGLQLVDGLATAHARGIIHRDLKPANIVLTPEGVVKIIDFGLAKLQGQAQLTRSGATMGTLAYMSPEQVRGEEADGRCDIWAMGVILYEMVTGSLPFEAEKESALLYAILMHDPKPMSSLRPEVPESLAAVIARALQKDPALRYPGMDQIAADLQAVAETVLPARASKQTGDRKRLLRRPARLRSRSARGTVRGGYARARRPWVPVLWAAAALAGSWLIYLLLGRGVWLDEAGQRAPAPDIFSAAKIVVMPFDVRGDPAFAYLGEGMADLLSAKLDGAGQLRSVDTRAVLGHIKRQGARLRDPQDGTRIARRFSADYYIMGAILVISGELQFNASLYRTRGRPIAIARASASGTDSTILDAIDHLAFQLLGGLMPASRSRVRELATLTTSSLSALKWYLQGESRFRAGRYHEALQSFQRAVTEDPQFPLAYYRLSLAADWLTRPDIASEAAAKAVVHADRLPERTKTLLSALRAWQTGDVAQAEYLYRVITGAYPEDVEAWFQLGEVLFHYGPIQGKSIRVSREAFERVLDLEPDYVPALFHLARIAAASGDWEHLNELAARIEKLQPEGERMLEILALRAFATGDQSAVPSILKALDQASDLVLVLALWNVAVYAADFDGARQVAELFTRANRSREARTLGHILIAHLEMAAGRPLAADAALAAAAVSDSITAEEYRAMFALLPIGDRSSQEYARRMQHLQRLSAQPAPQYLTQNIFFTVHNGAHRYLQTYLLALLHARLGDASAALRLARRLSAPEMQDRDPILAKDLSLSVQAVLAMQEGDLELARSLHEQMHINTWYGLMATSPLFSRALARYTFAENLARLGRLQDALVWFGSFGEYSIYDLVYLAPAHRRRAEIYDRLGQHAEAIAHYRHFVRLWQNCEPALYPLLTQAESRIATLTGNSPTH